MSAQDRFVPLVNFWLDRVDWTVVSARLKELPHIGNLVSLQELQAPRHGRGQRFYGVHPLARELGCDSLEKQSRLLDKRLERAQKIRGGPARAQRLACLPNPSEQYWTWLSEIEFCDLFKTLGIEVEFSCDRGAADLKLRFGAGAVDCEITTVLKQELGLFELRQLLDWSFARRYCFWTNRRYFGKAPSTPPQLVWGVFGEIRSRIEDGTYGCVDQFEGGGVPFEVFAIPWGSTSGAIYPSDFDEGRAVDTINCRVREACAAKAAQLKRSHPNVLGIALVQDPICVKAFRELDRQGTLWSPTADHLGHADALFLYDTGCMPPRLHGPWVRSGGGIPIVGKLCSEIRERWDLLLGGNNTDRDRVCSQ